MFKTELKEHNARSRPKVQGIIVTFYQIEPFFWSETKHRPKDGKIKMLDVEMMSKF